MLLLLILVQIFTHAQAKTVQIEFRCRPLNPPSIQGEEKFLKLRFYEQKGVWAELAGIAGPAVELSTLAPIAQGYYSHDSSSASANWKNENGELAHVSLAYFGSWWGAVLQVSQEFPLYNENIPSGSSFDFRCEEFYPKESS